MVALHQLENNLWILHKSKRIDEEANISHLSLHLYLNLLARTI